VGFNCSGSAERVIILNGLTDQYLRTCCSTFADVLFRSDRNIQGVKKMSDGTHRTYSLGRGSYRLWDSSRELKKIMKQEKEDDYNNCLSVEMEKTDSVDSINIYKSENEDLLRQFVCRCLLSVNGHEKLIHFYPKWSRKLIHPQ